MIQFTKGIDAAARIPITNPVAPTATPRKDSPIASSWFLFQKCSVKIEIRSGKANSTDLSSFLNSKTFRLQLLSSHKWSPYITRQQNRDYLFNHVHKGINFAGLCLKNLSTSKSLPLTSVHTITWCVFVSNNLPRSLNGTQGNTTWIGM